MVARVAILLLAVGLSARASVWSVTNSVSSIATQSVSAAAGEVRLTVAARSGGLAVDLSNMTSCWAIVDARDLEPVTNAPGRTLDATDGVVRFSAPLPVGSFIATASVYPPVGPAFVIASTLLTVTSPFPAVVQFITQTNLVELPPGTVTNGMTNVVLAGSFSGNGGSLTNVSASIPASDFMEIAMSNESVATNLQVYYALPFNVVSMTNGQATSWSLQTNTLTINRSGLYSMSGQWHMKYAGTQNPIYSFVRATVISGGTTNIFILLGGDPSRNPSGEAYAPLAEKVFNVVSNSASILWEMTDRGYNRVTNAVGTYMSIRRISE